MMSQLTTPMGTNTLSTVILVTVFTDGKVYILMKLVIHHHIRIRPHTQTVLAADMRQMVMCHKHLIPNQELYSTLVSNFAGAVVVQAYLPKSPFIHEKFTYTKKDILLNFKNNS
jgi:hypothetical protein